MGEVNGPEGHAARAEGSQRQDGNEIMKSSCRRM